MCIRDSPNAAQDVDLKMFITTMQMDAVYSCSGSDTDPNNRYQKAYNLIGDVYAGYMSGTNNWDGGTNPQIYALNGSDWCNVPFSESFTNVMPAWLQLKYAHANGLLSDDIFAVANILKVMSLHRVSDIYGPLPVLHFGETENPYNSQEECYMHFFETLDSAIAVLKDVVENNPDAKPLEEVDALYHGDYSKWLKLANSVKLRLAMRICYVKPDLAKQYAMEAVRDGVMETADDSALFQSWGSITIINPLEKIWNGYSDTRMGASMDSYLNGYNDPRLPVYFQPVTEGDNKGEYRGVANGMPNPQQDDYKAMSAPNVQEKSTDSPLRWMMASEVAFLRAEGAMRGWTAEMGGTAEEFYNKGIELSVESHNIVRPKFHWSTTLTLSHNEQKVDDIGSEDFISAYNSPGNNPYMMYGYVKGYPLNSLWGFKYGGTWKSAEEREENAVTKTYVSPANTDGGPRYYDTNHDGVLSREDLIYQGNADPYLYGGLQNTFYIHGFKLGVYFAYSLGGKIYNYSAVSYTHLTLPTILRV